MGNILQPWLVLYERLLAGVKYAVLTSGDLYIYNAGPSDGYKSYACRTVHRLTGEVNASAYPGRIIITGKKKLEMCSVNISETASFSLIME